MAHVLTCKSLLTSGIVVLFVACGTKDPAKVDDVGQEGSGTALPAAVDDGSAGATSSDDATVVINEIVASNVTGKQDEDGGTGDWIELFNLTDDPINLGGYFISDKVENPQRHELSSDLVVPAGGVLLLWADSDTYQGPNHLSFNLNKDGEWVLLSSPDGNWLDGRQYSTAVPDTALARFPDGTGEFSWCTSPSPGELNGDSCGS